MPDIHLLDQDTINKIAAGEVVERPSAVVKEMVENAIDAGAGMITVEIKDGGEKMIRITDNGSGISPENVKMAFMPHATSKITDARDLSDISSLGFRGEALASIDSVSRMEMLSKTRDSFIGTRYTAEGGKNQKIEEAGCPDGTTFIVRDLFFNTPARKKFLKKPQTEAGYIGSMLERIALSHPDISIHFINQSQQKLVTSGNGDLKDTIFRVFGRETAQNLIEVNNENDSIKITGYIGKPSIARGNKKSMNYFVNGRCIQSSVVQKAVTDAYEPYIMLHKFPFTCFYIDIDPSLTDVNVHPQKMEIRFSDSALVYRMVFNTVKLSLEQRELIPDVDPSEVESFPGNSSEKARAAAAKEAAKKDFKNYRTLNGVLHSESSGSYINSVSEGSGTYPGEKKGFLKNKAPEKRTSGVIFTEDSISGILGNPKDRENSTEKEIHDLFSRNSENKKTDEVFEKAAGNSENHGNDEIPKKDVAPESVYGNQDFKKIGSRESVISKCMKSSTDGENTKEGSDSFTNAESALEGTHDSPKLNLSAAENSGAYEERENEKEKADQENPPRQLDMFEDDEGRREKIQKETRIIGQVFDTYWIIQYDDAMYIVDQHAAHEKVNYERFVHKILTNAVTQQQLNPPIIVSLSLAEENVVNSHEEDFRSLGFEIEPFGGHDYAISAVPDNLPELGREDLFKEMIDSLMSDSGKAFSKEFKLRIATMACKSAIKGNMSFPREEMENLLKELMTLDNPYNCPHGRPTMVKFTKRSLEKMFKRIVD